MKLNTSETAVRKALRELLAAIYFADNSDYLTALHQAAQTLAPELDAALDYSVNQALKELDPEVFGK